MDPVLRTGVPCVGDSEIHDSEMPGFWQLRDAGWIYEIQVSGGLDFMESGLRRRGLDFMKVRHLLDVIEFILSEAAMY